MAKLRQASSTLVSLSVSLPAWAQSAPPTAAAVGDQAQSGILVTRSRIRRDALDEPTPVTIVHQAAIERTGLTSVADRCR